MENHPIPQNVTGFQFKLIGNMTIKQFAYLATGVVLAWSFSFAPFPGFIRFPIAFVVGFFGFALAFIPIDGRPLDVMTLYFIRALFIPNQFIYQKGALQQTQLNYPSPITTQTPQLVIQQPQVATPEVNKQVTTPQPTQKQPTIASTTPTQQLSKTEYDQLLAKLAQTQNDKKLLENELETLKQMLIKTQKQSTLVMPQPLPQPTVNKQTILTPPQQSIKPTVKKITIPIQQKPTGLPISDTPNVLTGIIKDSRGNVLSNILVEVKDKEGNPVRAFKTNALGQFASATSLLNGVYTLEFEDPQGKHTFDVLELTMNGDVIGPIEATSIDQREELRKSLFGNT